jgi:hypothetical protein
MGLSSFEPSVTQNPVQIPLHKHLFKVHRLPDGKLKNTYSHVMYRYLIHNIRPPGIPVFPFGDASYLARNTNLGELRASGRIAMNDYFIMLDSSNVSLRSVLYWSQYPAGSKLHRPVKSDDFNGSPLAPLR